MNYLKIYIITIFLIFLFSIIYICKFRKKEKFEQKYEIFYLIDKLESKKDEKGERGEQGDKGAPGGLIQRSQRQLSKICKKEHPHLNNYAVLNHTHIWQSEEGAPTHIVNQNYFDNKNTELENKSSSFKDLISKVDKKSIVLDKKPNNCLHYNKTVDNIDDIRSFITVYDNNVSDCKDLRDNHGLCSFFEHKGTT